MAKAIWSGSLSFGLVNIPVRLYNATAPKDVRFHQFERGTNRRIRYRRVTESEPAGRPWKGPPEDAASWSEPPGVENDLGSAAPAPAAPYGDGPEVPPERRGNARPAEVAYGDVVKGFEIEPERYVMVSPDELRALEPERSQAIEIEGFVDLSEIDPFSFEKSYYVAPQRGVGAERPYALLLESLRRSNRVGIARFVMRTKEYLAAIRPMDGVLGLETLFYADEIRAASEIDNVPQPTEVPERELAVAEQFIDLLEMAWEPSRYVDPYRERVLELLRQRAEEEGVVEQVAAEAEAPTSAAAVPDLMAALKASVEAARERAAEGERPKRKRRTG
jgi:DNA end-binding protein Ku